MEEWDLSADAEPDAEPGTGPGTGPDIPPGAGGQPPGRGALGLLAGLAGLLLVAGFVVWHPHSPEPPKPGPPAVLGDRLAAPVRLLTPAGTVAVADRDHVGLQYAEGSLLVTVPSEVVQPDGARTVLPSDPVTWLEQHPDVFVSRVRTVLVAGREVTQLDYRRSRNAQPQSQFARLPLFCVNPDDCTRITANARVRATFVPVGDRTVLVEAVWLTDNTATTRPTPGAPSPQLMPTGLRRVYTQLLTSLTTSARG